MSTGLKVYILADLEGVSGVFQFDNYYDHKHVAGEKPRTRVAQLMVGEVNAAVEGALAAGADTVVVRDAHGYSDTLPVEKLHPKAWLSQGNHVLRPLPHLTREFDALVMIGQHAKSRNHRAGLSHTYSRRIDRIQVNGMEVGEILLNAALAGELSVPTVSVSGDNEAVNEAREHLSGIRTVQTKVSHSLTCSLSRPPQVVSEAIRIEVEKAIAERQSIKPFVFESPVNMRVTYRSWTINLGRYALRKQWRVGKLAGIRTAVYSAPSLSSCWMRFVYGCDWDAEYSEAAIPAPLSIKVLSRASTR